MARPPASAEPRRAIVLVDHGSRIPEANELVFALAERLRGALPGTTVECAHLEISEPTVAQAVERCLAAGAREIILHPYFLAPGRHSRDDIPALLRAARARHPGVRFGVTDPLGPDDKLAEIVLERIAAASFDEEKGDA